MLWRERIMWIGFALALAATARMYSNKYSSAVDSKIEMMTSLISAQQEALKATREVVKVAERSVEIAAQGRNDCAQGLEAVTERQRFMANRLGLKDSLEANK